MVEPLGHQLLGVLPVGGVLRYGLQGRQDLGVETPQTLRQSGGVSGGNTQGLKVMAAERHVRTRCSPHEDCGSQPGQPGRSSGREEETNGSIF